MNARAMNPDVVVIVVVANLVIHVLPFTQKGQHNFANISEDADPP